jgi:hypothetical protein
MAGSSRTSRFFNGDRQKVKSRCYINHRGYNPVVVPTSRAVSHNISAYVCLTWGAVWLITAIFLYGRSFGIYWEGSHPPALLLWLFPRMLPVLFFGWLVPVLLGAWLLWKR